MEKNFINFRLMELDEPISRVFTVQRILEIFANNKNSLVHPIRWDDPFENFIMNASGELNGRAFSIGDDVLKKHRRCLLI